MKVVVGVSAVVENHPAIDWAVDFTRNRGATLELVHVVDTTWGRAPEGDVRKALLLAEEELRDRARLIQENNPGVVVESHVRLGSPVNELVNAADGATCLVIGAHPAERFDGASRLVVRIARLSPCSVIVVPSDVIPTGSGVVVGVDGSAESDLAVEFAADMADRHRESLTVVLAWGRPEAWGLLEPDLVEADPSQEDLLILAESIAGLATRYPDLAVTSEVSASRPERALYAASVDARMLVVGSRGHYSLAKALLGSTGEALVADLPCSVAIIRAATTS